MDPQILISILLGVVQLALTVVLFLVGRLLASNKEAVDALRLSLRDVTKVLESLRHKVGDLEVGLARLEAVTSTTASSKVRPDAS